MDYYVDDLESEPKGFSGLVNHMLTYCYPKVHTCFHVKVPQHWEIRDRVNSDYHIMLVKGGQGGYTVGDGDSASYISFDKHKLIFISNGLLHSVCQNWADPPVIIPVRFGLYDRRTQQPLTNLPGEPFSFSFVPKQRVLFQQLFERLYYDYSSERDCRDKLCSTVLSEILIRCSGELEEAEYASQWDTRIEKMKRIVDEHPEVHYTSAELAEMANLSEKYCRKLFIRQYGMTPMAYQTRARLEYACFMLFDSSLSVKEVALTLGYPDPYTFSKQFKKVLGYSPGKLL